MPRQRATPVLTALRLTLGASLLGGVLGAALAPPAYATPAAHATPAARAASAARAAVAAIPGSKPRHSRHGAQRPVNVTLPPPLAGTGVTVAAKPVGLSLEYPTMARDLGTGACPPPALVTQLQALGSPPLELAGNSQDLTAPAGALSGAPVSWETATLYSLPATFWSQLQCLLNAAKDPLTVGLNAKTGPPSWAEQMVAGAQSAAGAVGDPSFSLGNEPDLYGLPNYASLSRPLPGKETAAANTYLRVVAALAPALAGAPVIGPELARPTRWQHRLPGVIAAMHPQTVGVHMYPLSACATPRAVTIHGLLSPSVGDAPRRLSWVVADALAVHTPAIISEANSASCGGVSGVSDSPASAVWAVRFVLSALKTGFQEVRFHFSGAPYDPFVVSGEQVITRPVDSAMVALNRWLAPGAKLQTLKGVRGLVASAVSEPATNATGAPATGATGAPTGVTMVILDNEGAHARRVLVRGAQVVRAETFSSTRTGVQTALLRAHRGRVGLSLAPNAVVALTPSSSSS
jgi:hypothetical protein